MPKWTKNLILFYMNKRLSISLFFWYDINGDNMDSTKIKNIIIVGLISFFYFLLFYTGLNVILYSFKMHLFDTIFMMATYTMPVFLLIFTITYDKSSKLLFNKKTIIFLFSILLIFLIISYFFSLGKDIKDSPSRKEQQEQKELEETYENATDLENLKDYKKEEDIILKKDEMGHITKYKPIEADSITKCTYLLFQLDNGFILACSGNLKTNFYTEDGESYYQLNVNKLDKKEGSYLTTIKKDSSYKDIILEEEDYIYRISYNTLSIFKHFMENYYFKVNSIDLEKEIEKTHNIYSWFVTEDEIIFINKDFLKYKAIAIPTSLTTVSINYEKQLR